MDLLIGLIILIFSAILHEVAHGFVADKLGDPTARLSGRLTLNPVSHIDPFMTILLPLLLIISHSPVLFGGAKPVPVDPFNLREGRKDLALVSLAGPLTNIALAIAAAALFHLSLFSQIFFFQNILQLIASINLMLAIFNLLPIPPLDGSKIVALFLPEREAYQYLSLGQFGIVILFLLLVTPIGGFSLSNFIATLNAYAVALLGL